MEHGICGGKSKSKRQRRFVPQPRVAESARLPWATLWAGDHCPVRAKQPSSGRRGGRERVAAGHRRVTSLKVQIRPQPYECGFSQHAVWRQGSKFYFAHQFRLNPDRARIVERLLFDGSLDRFQCLKLGGASPERIVVESRSDFADIFQFLVSRLGQMQRAEARFAIALAPRVTDDRAFEGLSSFGF